MTSQPETTEKVKRRITTNMEVIKMGKLLDEHCQQVPETNLFKYEEGWDDERIAHKTGEGLNREHARRMRSEYKGELAPESMPQTKTYRDPRVSLLIERFNELCNHVGDDTLQITVEDLKIVG